MEFPQTKEMGWVLDDSGKQVYVPTKKSFWNRLQFIVESIGGTLERNTTGFDITGCKISPEAHEAIREEIRISGVNGTNQADVQRSESGREEPNLEDFNSF